MTDTERIATLKNQLRQAQGELEIWQQRAEQWEAQAEMMTKKKLESDRNAYAAEQSEARIQERLDQLQVNYNKLQDAIGEDFDQFMERMATK